MAVFGYWVHDLSPVIFQIGDRFGLRWYGLAYLLGFLAGWLLIRLYHRRGRSPLAPPAQADLIVAAALGVLLGGRFGYVIFYQLGETLQDPLNFFRIWKGGMASHGGFVGVIAAAWWLARKNGISLARMSDLLATLTPPGFLLGRVANFINGELWGKPSTLPWAVIFPASAPPGTPLAAIAPRHPSQLYEAALEGLFLLIYTQWRFWRTDVTATPGRLAGEFLVLYALVRVLGEMFREPDAGLILGLSRGVFYSLFLLAGGILMILRTRRAERVA